MSTLYTQSGKNTRNFYILGIFIFSFSLFFQSLSLGSSGLSDSSFFDYNIFGISAAKGSDCAAVPPNQPPVEGLVPCGRIIDNQDTPFINEHAPCDICALFYMLKKTINFGMEISFALAVLIIVISGFLYVFSVGDGKIIDRAKNAVYYTLLGLAIMFTAWLVVASALKALGYGDIANWNQVNCNLVPGGHPTVLPFCGDGIVNNGEMCDWSVPPNSRPCKAIVADGLPSYCEGIMSEGTQDCNCACDGWNACVATNAPVLIANNYGECRDDDTYLTDYPCCVLTGCHNDGCCGGRNSADATLPEGYTLRDTLTNVDVNRGNCKIGQMGNNWVISINHTTAGYECWR